MPGETVEIIGDQYSWNNIKFRNRHPWGPDLDMPTVSGPTAGVLSHDTPEYSATYYSWYSWFNLSDDLFDLRGRDFTMNTRFVYDGTEWGGVTFSVFWGGLPVSDMLSDFKCYEFQIWRWMDGELEHHTDWFFGYRSYSSGDIT
ncbi:MAG TPA: hypothetical protein PLB62_16745, partial [Candidatus Sumerlaeota bacterium]|nr:hypothetical protein [Candidatus Sumerlaeota bacterium]